MLKGEADGLAPAGYRLVAWGPDGDRVLAAALGVGTTILGATPLGR